MTQPSPCGITGSVKFDVSLFQPSSGEKITLQRVNSLFILLADTLLMNIILHSHYKTKNHVYALF